MSTIPCVIFKFTALEKLDLSFNFIEDINPRLCFLTRLTDFNISNNRIDSYGLGCSIKNLINIIELDLSDNKISFLLPKTPQPWEFFVCLTALRRLELQGNDLRELPWEWGCITSLSELSISLKSSTLPEVLTAWSMRGIQGIVDAYATKTTVWLADQYSGKILNDTSRLESAIQCRTPGDTLAMDEVDPIVHSQSLVSLVSILHESELANQSALMEYKYLLSSTSEWHVPGLFLPLSQIKSKPDLDPSEIVSKKMSTFKSLQNKPKMMTQEDSASSKKNYYACGASTLLQSAEQSVFKNPFSQIPSIEREEDMHRHENFLQESGKIWGARAPSKPNVDDVLEALETIDSISHNLIFGSGEGCIEYVSQK
jgi:hypothetical protein